MTKQTRAQKSAEKGNAFRINGDASDVSIEDQFQVLKDDLNRLSGLIKERAIDSTAHRKDAIAETLETTLNKTTDALSSTKGDVQQTVSDRPFAALAVAAGIGFALGFLRK